MSNELRVEQITLKDFLGNGRISDPSLLFQVCVSITKNPELLEFCFDISAQHGPSRFIIFSLLIPFVHRDGLAGTYICLVCFPPVSRLALSEVCSLLHPLYLDKPSVQGISAGGRIV